MKKPAATEIPYTNPFDLFAPHGRRTGAVLLDSSSHAQGQGRYSFIALDPDEIITIESPLDFQYLKERLTDLKRPKIKGLPPFQGGMAGFFSYEMQHLFEKLPSQKHGEFQTPLAILGIYETVAAFDHQTETAWIIGPDQKRIERLHERFSSLAPKQPTFSPCPLDWQADFDEADYIKQVDRVRRYILAGDIFQANLTQKFVTSLPADFSPLAFYSNLRKINPAPFSAYLHFDTFQIACSSPERYLKLEEYEVSTCPIKGTRPRSPDPKTDQELAKNLRDSAKDAAENTMIVDLLRNDLSRVCIPHSVKVPELCELYSFASVHHLISRVNARLSQTMDGFDLIKAAFPGGSITGAPKVRAMEIITEIEKTQRGPYCGAIGYMDFSGDMDLNIVIRSVLFQNNKACLQVGGGIVADSVPKEEYQEMQDKAKALFTAFSESF